MNSGESTCWTIVMQAAQGDHAARGRFAELYLAIVRAYLISRWRTNRLMTELDDAVQEVFLECYRPGGALSRLDRDGPGAFRTFLFAVVTNVARRHEERVLDPRRATPDAEELARVADDALTQSVAFDREWARAMLAQARERHRSAAANDADALQRVDLLDLRFREGLPIRGIAERWKMPAERVHALYRKAREEFKLALRAEVAFQGHRGEAAAERECRRILEIVSADR